MGSGASDPSVAAKLRSLHDLLARTGPLVVAVSGGLDSRFLAHAALAANAEVSAVFLAGPHMTPKERDWARHWLDGWGGPWQELAFDPLALAEPEIDANGRMRCYHCKRAAFTRILELAAQLGAAAAADGSNRSDRQAFRPGAQALAEMGVLSPLDAAGLEKSEIRAAARDAGLERWDQPARPCLLTRFAYGERPGRALVAALGRAEDALMDLGLTEFRVRLKGSGQGCLLQLGPAESAAWAGKAAAAEALLAAAGFGPVQVEQGAGVSGYFDR